MGDETTELDDKWNILDVLRVLGGIAIIMLAIFWQIGGFQRLSGTKWVTRQYWGHLMRGAPYQEFTVESLLESRKRGETLVGLNGTVYNVGSNGEFYKSSRYRELLGQDCTTLFITGEFSMDRCEAKWVSSEANATIIQSWEDLYNRKYVAVGEISS